MKKFTLTILFIALLFPMSAMAEQGTWELEQVYGGGYSDYSQMRADYPSISNALCLNGTCDDMYDYIRSGKRRNPE
ncbi:MAG: hypothetical protein GY749_24465 [Desulfobacteraceae bacterium]|nr:hypothetical protein [Desulfobacteraceae bacterium]